MRLIIHRFVLMGTIGGLMGLTACTAVNPYTGQNRINDTTKGTILGAGTGAAIGALAGGGKGALIGTAVGSVAGAGVGYWLDKENEELRQELVGSGVQVRKNGSQIELVMSSDISFTVNSADINSAFYPTLNSVAKVLKKYSNQNVLITGYTDNSGSVTYNQQLSAHRADSVAAYLGSHGISINKIFTKGMGELNPIASNSTAAGRSKNRRVEIILRGK